MVAFVFDMGRVPRAARAAVAASGDAAGEAANHNQHEDRADDRADLVAFIVAAAFGALFVIEVALAASVLVVPLALRRAAAGGGCDGLRVLRSVVRWVAEGAGERAAGGRADLALYLVLRLVGGVLVINLCHATRAGATLVV